MRLSLLFFSMSSLLLFGCIGDDYIDDFVSPGVRITNPADTLALGSTYQFEATFFDGVGLPQENTLIWTSSEETIISISDDGLAEALLDGESLITVAVSDNPSVSSSKLIATGLNTVLPAQERTASVASTSSYALEGDCILHFEGTQLVLEFESNFSTSDELPGLFVYLSNNPNSIVGAYEIAPVTTFNGAHSYDIPSSIGLYDYNHVLFFCAPFNVKVGVGSLSN
ncbi:MAG: hypothetical protein ACI84C_001837 [Flavobacteriales bacterium]|jgi:hypothetical protein